jgi:hypothetical protein
MVKKTETLQDVTVSFAPRNSLPMLLLGYLSICFAEAELETFFKFILVMYQMKFQ